MYKVQASPGKAIELKNGSVVTPVCTLKDEHGGISHIIIDDHCYVLVNRSDERGFATVKHWYPEAVAAMADLPRLHLMGECTDEKPCNACFSGQGLCSDLERSMGDANRYKKGLATYLFRMGAARIEEDVSIPETKDSFRLVISRGTQKPTVGEILQKIYDSELHLRIGWLWDGGLDYSIGSTSNDLWDSTLNKSDIHYTSEKDMANGIEIMADHLATKVPNSDFAKWWNKVIREDNSKVFVVAKI
jgi:hypothetical protein